MRHFDYEICKKMANYGFLCSTESNLSLGVNNKITILMRSPDQSDIPVFILQDFLDTTESAMHNLRILLSLYNNLGLDPSGSRRVAIRVMLVRILDSKDAIEFISNIVRYI